MKIKMPKLDGLDTPLLQIMWGKVYCQETVYPAQDHCRRDDTESKRVKRSEAVDNIKKWGLLHTARQLHIGTHISCT